MASLKHFCPPSDANASANGILRTIPSRHVDSVRRALEALNRRDVEALFAEIEPAHVIAATHVRARGRDGIESEAHGAWLWTFQEDGRASRVKLCQSKADALAAAGAA